MSEKQYINISNNKTFKINTEIEEIEKKNQLEKNVKTEKKNYIKRKDREPRHYSPANKEWNNSVYTFNKNTLLNMAVKDKIASSSIKSYFNLVPVPLIITKSKRMRDLIRRSSTKQLFTSKPEIKQTSDKAIITVYTFDREKRFFFRKLFMLRKWLNESLMGRKLKLKKSKNNLITKFVGLNKKYKRNLMRTKHIIYRRKTFSYKKKRSILKRYISKYRIKHDLYVKTANILSKKKSYFINIYLYLCLIKIYAKLGKKIKIVPSSYIFLGRGKKKKKKVFVNLVIKPKENKYVIRTEEGKIRHYKHKPIQIIKMRKNYFNIKTLKSINIILINLLSRYGKKETFFKLPLFINKHKHYYLKTLKKKYLKKEILIIKYLSKLYINKLKFYNYLPGLKNLLAKIYNKKIQLNLVNLKNLHLNSDMFSEAISVKLRKRTTGLLRIIRKSFNFVKAIKPKDEFIMLQKRKNVFKKEINTYFGKQNVINGNIINTAFREMFKNNKSVIKQLNNESSTTTTISSVLKSLKYKWVTGVRVEAKGRLTKRYAASRALFKYKYRGTLKNLEFLKNIENDLQSPGVFMLRGDLRPNSQYSLIHSKRRIGAFGIKGWISSS